jgi:hypothetical protein
MEHTQHKHPHLEQLLDQTDTRLLAFHQDMAELFDVRHALFHLPDSLMRTNAPESEQPASASLYDEPSYNGAFLQADLGLRGGGSLEFHQETESYNPNPSDSPELAEKKRMYRRKILEVAQKHGFVAQEPGEATSDIDRELGILDSTLKPIEGPVDIIVAGAAGLANIVRTRDALRNIESGTVTTNHIILTGCERPISERERANLEQKGFSGGATEYESLLRAAEQVLGAEFGKNERAIAVPYGDSLQTRLSEGTAVINGQNVRITVLSAPFDPKRMVGDKPAARANTEETFLAAMPLLEDGHDVLIVSHDTWVPYQQGIGELTLGTQTNKVIHCTGPLKADRVYWADDGEMDIKDAQGVVDEMAKVYRELMRNRVAIVNASEGALQ